MGSGLAGDLEGLMAERDRMGSEPTGDPGGLEDPEDPWDQKVERGRKDSGLAEGLEDQLG